MILRLKGSGAALFLSLSLLGACNLFGPQADSGRRVALVIGGSHYAKNRELRPSLTGSGNLSPNLKAVSYDVAEMARRFHDGGWEVWLRIDDGDFTDTGHFVGQEPSVREEVAALVAPLPEFEGPSRFGAGTRIQILEDLDRLSQELGPGDQLLVYYAGHGFNDLDPGLFLPPTGPEGEALGDRSPGWEYLALWGTVIPDAFSTSYTLDFSHSLSDKELADQLGRFDPRVAKSLILDACRTGGFLEPDWEREIPLWDQLWSGFRGLEIPSRGDLHRRNTLVLSAAGELELSIDDARDKKNGYFTYYLLEGLNQGGADTNQDGWVSLSELWAYTDLRLRQEPRIQVAAPLPGRPSRTVPSFTPRLSGGPVDQLLLRVR